MSETPKPVYRILVVDDATNIRDFLKERLTFEGHAVVQAANGREARKMYDAQPQEIDLIISDIDMPGEGGDGITLANYVLGLPSRPRIMLGSADMSSPLTLANIRAMPTQPDATYEKPVDEPFFLSLCHVMQGYVRPQAPATSTPASSPVVPSDIASLLG